MLKVLFCFVYWSGFSQEPFSWQVSATSHTVRNSTLVKPQLKQSERQHFPVEVKGMPQFWAGPPAIPTTLCRSRSLKQPVPHAAPQLCWFLVLWPTYGLSAGPHWQGRLRSPASYRAAGELNRTQFITFLCLSPSL